MSCEKCVKTEQSLKEVLARLEEKAKELEEERDWVIKETLARLEEKAKELEEERAMVIDKPAMGLAVLGKQEIVSNIRREILNILAGNIDF